MDELSGRFGPQTAQIEAILALARSLSAAEVQMMRVFDAVRVTEPIGFEPAELGVMRRRLRDEARVVASDLASEVVRRRLREKWRRESRVVTLHRLYKSVSDAVRVGLRDMERYAKRHGMRNVLNVTHLAVQDAVLALSVRHLVGSDFTQEHYDSLTTPLARVIGKVHPDDVEWRHSRKYESLRNFEELEVLAGDLRRDDARRVDLVYADPGINRV